MAAHGLTRGNDPKNREVVHVAASRGTPLRPRSAGSRREEGGNRVERSHALANGFEACEERHRKQRAWNTPDPAQEDDAPDDLNGPSFVSQRRDDRNEFP